MIRNGLVTSVIDGAAEIEVEECEECKSCGACSLFGKQPRVRIRAPGVKPGDRVTVEAARGMVGLGSTLVFSMPSLAFLAGAGLCFLAGKSMDVAALRGNGAMFLAGILSAIAMFLIVRKIDARVGREKTIVRVVEIHRPETVEGTANDL